MTVPAPSMLSVVADALRTDINTLVSGAPKVSVGTPAEAEPGASDTDPRVNLFFYGFAPSGFEADAGAGDPFRVRIRCIVTAYGPAMPDPTATTGATISAGEVDLRLIGGVIQHFHANPVREVAFLRSNPATAQTEEIRSALQIVFTPLQAEEINQIWSTQGEAAYRPSVAYELALVPITPWTLTPVPAPTGAFALGISTFDPATARDSEAAGGGPRLDILTDPERSAIDAGKATPPEVPPTLSFDAAPGVARMAVFAAVTSGAGGAFVTPDPATLALTYTHAADLGAAALILRHRAAGAWVEARNDALTVPPGGGAVAIAFAVPTELGEFMLSVEAERTGPPSGSPPRRSNPLALIIEQAPEASA